MTGILMRCDRCGLHGLAPADGPKPADLVAAAWHAAHLGQPRPRRSRPA